MNQRRPNSKGHFGRAAAAAGLVLERSRPTLPLPAGTAAPPLRHHLGVGTGRQSMVHGTVSISEPRDGRAGGAVAFIRLVEDGALEVEGSDPCALSRPGGPLLVRA